jgi:Uma2 family endonuclease
LAPVGFITQSLAGKAALPALLSIAKQELGETPVSAATHPITVAEYDQRITSPDDDPVELLDGEVVRKMPKSPLHCVATRKTFDTLARLVPPAWNVVNEDSLVCGDRSKLEPDVSIVRAKLRHDATRDATADDCALVVEIADASLATDRGAKLTIYARAGIPVYWIVNLIDDQVEVWSGPDRAFASYGLRVVYRRGQFVFFKVVGQIAVEDLLP